MKRRGLALSAVLYVVFAVLMFGLMLASLASFQYQLGHDSISRMSSFYAAQAGLSQSIYDLSADATWGKHNESISNPVGNDGSTYSITFQSGTNPYSVNNLAGGVATPGWRGQMVPPYTALLVSRGVTARGTYPRVVEALVQYAPYPYAIAANDVVNSAGGPLMVGGGSSLATALLGGSDIAGHVYSGSSSPTAVTGGAFSTITGKVRTPGNASFGPGSQVVQGIDAGIAPESLPNVAINNFNDVNNQNVIEVASGTTLVGLVTGVIHAQGDLTLIAPVLLDAYIYVDNGGNLSSNAAMIGTGSIFVTGKTSLEGAVNADAATGIAIFSQGDLTISSGQLFQGVLYSQGNIDVAAGITVLGSIISSNGRITLGSGANVTYVPEYTQFGNGWTTHQMQGSALSGNPPLMRQLFWREYQP